MALSVLLACLSGCGTVKHKSQDVTYFSIVCAHSNYDRSYSFTLRIAENVWLFSAECCVRCAEPRVEIENVPISHEDAEKALDLILGGDVIRDTAKYRGADTELFVCDETTYRTSVGFRGGGAVEAPIGVSDDIVEFLFRLAEKYGCSDSDAQV